MEPGARRKGPDRRAPPFVQHLEAGVVLGDPNEAVLRLALRARVWAFVYALTIGVVGALVMAGHPRALVAVVAALQLAAWLPLPVAIVLRQRRSQDARALGGTLLWLVVFTSVLSAALTGGLRSPLAPAVFVNFSALFSRYGLSRAGRIALIACSAATLALAVVPASWLGPPIAGPYFAVAAILSVAVSLGLHLINIAVLRDIATVAVSDAIRAREDLAEQAMARARDLELVGTRLSHELRNPLGAIKALVQILRRSAPSAPMREQLAVVEGEVDRMAEIVSAHLSFSRLLDRPRLATVRVGELSRAVVGAMHGRADAAGVRLRCAGEAPAVADARRLTEALFNLVANAIEASPAGATVEVAVDQDVAGTRVAVRDSGRGMPPEVLARIGTPFFTTREDGTGLGVVLARAVFEQHGGTLQYTSAPGQGTTAVGTLPRASAPASELSAAPAS